MTVAVFSEIVQPAPGKVVPEAGAKPTPSHLSGQSSPRSASHKLRRPRRTAGTYKSDLTTPSVIIGAPIVTALTQRPNRRAGPDTDATLLRWACWVALRTAETGAALVAATPREVGADFEGRQIGAGRDEGPMQRAGMSASTLSRHRKRFLSVAAVVSKSRGLYRLKRSKQFHAFDAGYVRWMVYEASNAALRAAFAASKPTSAARSAGASTVKAPARYCARRSGQGTTRWCRAFRELRKGGVLADNRPGRVKLVKHVAADGSVSFRRPMRRIVLGLSPMVPLAGPAIRWAGTQDGRATPTSDAIGHVNRDTEPTAVQAIFDGDPMQPLAGEESAERRAPTASPSAPHGGLIETSASKSAQPDSPATAAPSAPLVTCERQRRLPDSLKIKRVEVRRILAESGVVSAREAKNATDTAADIIARVCQTAGILRRVLHLERDVMTGDAVAADGSVVKHPIGWLAGMLDRVGDRVRCAGWAGSARTTGEGAQAATPAARARAESPAKVACRQALNRAAGDPRAMLQAAETMRATAEREGDAELAEAARMVEAHADTTARERAAREVHAAAVAKADAWPMWRAMLDVLEGADPGQFFARDFDSENTAAAVVAGVRWWTPGEAIVVTSPSYEQWGLNKRDPQDLAQGIARALTNATREGWRVVVENGNGVRLGTATTAASSGTTSPRPDEGARRDALDTLRAQGWDSQGREIPGAAAALARRVVSAGGSKRQT